MFLRTAKRFSTCLASSARFYSSSPKKSVKVAVMGGSGQVGAPLCLLLKQTPLISELALYDRGQAKGTAADLSHIDTSTKVKAFIGEQQMHDSLKGMDIVVITAGVPRKPGMTREDLFNVNAKTVSEMSEACAEVCPNAMIAIITNPVNVVVPIALEIFKKKGVDATNRIFGITTLDVVRANTFAAECKGLDVMVTEVPVIGGHSEGTIIPLLCQIKPNVKWTKEEIENVTNRVRRGGTEIVEAKEGAGSASLSMAYAGARFIYSLCRGLSGEENIAECAYVRSDVVPHVKYFATPLCLGPTGITKNLGISKLTDYENELLVKAIPELKKSIEKGEKFVEAGGQPDKKPGEKPGGKPSLADICGPKGKPGKGKPDDTKGDKPDGKLKC